PDGRTFLAACGDALRAGGVALIVATLPAPVIDGGASDELPLPVPPGVQAAHLPAAGLAMFDSLQIGFKALLAFDWERVVVLPVDHPLVRPTTVAALAASEGVAGIATWRSKHGHPVVLDRDLAEAIGNGRLTGPTLREVLSGAAAVDVAVDDPGVVANCNTPERLREALVEVPRRAAKS
ncbi:MAG: NTP transferase domain-containing protein, partial [Acidobacteria bacterium]|nr:NTP transferase domain-containing protein [Acidobacteriota bacterium]